MGIERTNQGGGKYSVPTIEVIEIATEKGFATSPVNGVPSSDGMEPLGSYDSFYDEQV